jgi:2-dehydro-3-deoxyphosphogalactonate aldolase
MKVSGYEIFPVANPTPNIGGPVWMFLRLDTDSGISGYGEVFTSSAYSPPLTLAKMMADMIEDFAIGRNPEDLELYTQSVYNSHYTRSMDLCKMAISSGIEIALWDILGKSLDRPVYSLMGGRIRERARMYSYLTPAPGAAEDFWSTPDAVGKRAIELVDLGFTGLKLDPFPLLTGGDSLAGQLVPVQPTPAFLKHAEDTLAAIRDAIGSRADIIVGTHGQFTAAGAIRVAERLKPFDLLWFEEPVPPETPGEMGKVARATTIPIAAGERLASKGAFAELIRHDAAAIFNFDVTQLGGLLEARKVAALAEANGVQVSPHVFGGPLVAAASMQLAVTLPNLLILEGNGMYDGIFADLLDEPLDWSHGYLTPSDRPGMGHNLNEDLARSLAVTPDHRFQYRRPPRAY